MMMMMMMMMINGVVTREMNINADDTHRVK
jgi:hypothetical protein